MCGILFVSTKEGSAIKPLMRRWRKQALRGREGFGYVCVDDKGYVRPPVRATTEKEIEEALRVETDQHILFHHRAPTSVPNFKEAAHPLSIESDLFNSNYYVIHNGVISNWAPLFEKYKQAGYIFKTEMREYSVSEFPNVGETYDDDPEIKVNDSECFAVDLASYLDGKQEGINAIGSISFIALQTNKEGKVLNLIWGHNFGNPLLEENDKTLFALKSQGKGAKELPTDIIYFKNWETGEITTRTQEVGTRFSYGAKQDKPKLGFQDKPPADVPGRAEYERFLDPTHPLLPEGTKISPLGRNDIDAGIASFIGRKGWGKDDERETNIPTINYEEDGTPDIQVFMDEDPYDLYEKAENELMELLEGEDLREEGKNDGEIIRELRKDLRAAGYELYGALNDLEEARALLQETVRGNADPSERDEAWAMAEAARQAYADAKNGVIASKVELENWLHSNKF